ncbi:MAG: hypothetical protein J6333_00340, partial [Planctomycetes bacterium]|nr:hypothetical protein [Planctomycetota bacterium]
VKTADAQVAAFDVPDKAREVSAPPEATYKVDHWGNVQDADMRIGQIVNRRTCKWHLDNLRANAFIQLGFLAFVDGDMDKARDFFQKMADADMRVQYLLREKKPNRYRRLMVRCETGAFRRSSLKDLKCFKDKRRRFVVFLADFNAESERPGRASELYQRLFSGEFGRLSPEEAGYVRFGWAWALWYDGVYSDKENDKKEAKGLLSAFMDDPALRKTAIAPRALNALANMLCYGGEKEFAKSLEIYRIVAREYPKTEHAETALYRLGAICANLPEPALK